MGLGDNTTNEVKSELVEATNELSVNYKNIKDLFAEDFFEKLGHFIFDENFDEFYDRKINEKANYRAMKYSLFWLNKEYFEDIMKPLFSLPLTFETFIDMYQTIGNCASVIDDYLFCIKYLVRELFEKEILSEDISIKLNKHFVIDFYRNEIEENLYNNSLDNLESLNFNDNKYLYIKENNINILVRTLLLSVFEYLLAYLEAMLDKITLDNQSLIKSYSQEARFNILSKIKNPTVELNDFKKSIKKRCKNIKTERHNAKGGRPSKELIDFPVETKKQLEKLETYYSNLLQAHPKIKRALRKIKYGTPADIINKIKIEILDYVNSCKLYGEFTLDDNGELIENMDIESEDAEMIELNAFIFEYINLKSVNNTSEFKDAVKYALLGHSGNLHLFKNCKFSDEAIRKFFEEKKDNCILVPLKEKCFWLYSTKEFLEPYKQLFFQ